MQYTSKASRINGRCPCSTEPLATTRAANTTEELEQRVEVLEATVVELGKDIDTVEMDVDQIQIDVSVANNDLWGNLHIGINGLITELHSNRQTRIVNSANSEN